MNGLLSIAYIIDPESMFRGISDVKDARRKGRPFIENVDKITEIIEVDRHVSSRSIAHKLKIDQKSVISHLRKVGFQKNLHVWVPHHLTPKNMMDQISICEALAKRNEIESFLKRMVTGEEKWVPYTTILSENDRGQSTLKQLNKPGLTASKHGQTLNSDLFYQQLVRLKLAIDQKCSELANRRGVVFHQDNASSYISVGTFQNLLELGWEVLMHSPYGTDLAPSDYHLFLALQNFLSDKKLGSREDCEN
ncbi:histone-lysine N-methyltransferase SETMAR [Trichonephila clavipes]|uniref:Histone-lysine N-methyltransferase SETMAR n=1 Tax=Trichonephila clavipes TaxID=2585209 RepID=A0A8X6S8U2_TRICX|nr:histone-lysine N-methyltransferase SETMAR [Trichonephila clavipes]